MSDRTNNTYSPSTESILDADTPCRRCGYNLRGLHHPGNCPECNAPIGLSTQGDLLRFADPKWIDRLALGCRLILWGLLASIASGFLAGCLAIALGNVLIGQVIGVLVSLIALYGAWLLTSPDPSGLEDERYTNARRLVRVSLAVGLSYGLLNLATPYLNWSGGLFVFFAFLLLLGGLCQAVGEVAKYFYLRTLAERIPNPAYANRARQIAWAYAIGMPMMIIGIVLAMIAVAPSLAAGAGGPAAAGPFAIFGPANLSIGGGGAGAGGTTAAPGAVAPTGAAMIALIAGGCFTGLAGIALFVFQILALILIYQLGQAFREQGHFARAIWAMQEKAGGESATAMGGDLPPT